MTIWFDICKVEDFRPNTFKSISLDDIEVMVFNIEGKYYAIEDQCTHDGGSLSDGELKGCEIICPRHAARFDVRTGHVTAPPAYEDLRTFPTRVEQGILQVSNEYSQ